MKGFGVSPITNRIYYGTLNEKSHMWTGEKVDVTDEVIRAVFLWFMGNMKGHSKYIVTFPGEGFELTMTRKE